MKIKIEIKDDCVLDIVEQVLIGRYKFDDDDEDFADKVKSAMANEEFMSAIVKNIKGEIEDNFIDTLSGYAFDFLVKSPKYYGLK
jgi:hypothetical protein